MHNVNFRMASKGHRSKLDHETRARRHKALEVPREPPRSKTHWDHLLEEMVWLSKDFEAERKWKLSQAKKVALRASKSILEQANRGEKKVKDEELKLKKVALNISKDVKKFWLKIEKLVHYKHQLEMEERKKKALDKQLDFLLGQTERYSTMLAENLVDMPGSLNSMLNHHKFDQECGSTAEKIECAPTDRLEECQNNHRVDDGDYSIHSTDELEDDEFTIEEDEALITEEERKEELAALQSEADMPLEELLKRYNTEEGAREGIPEMIRQVTRRERKTKDSRNMVNGVNHVEKPLNLSQVADFEDDQSHDEIIKKCLPLHNLNNHHPEVSNGEVSQHELEIKALVHDPIVICMEDNEYVPSDADDELDDETTLAEEEEREKKEKSEHFNETMLLQQESEIPIEELLARYRKGATYMDKAIDFTCTSSSTDEIDLSVSQVVECRNSTFPVGDSVEYENLTDGREVNFEDIEEKHDKVGIKGENIIADAAAAARSAQPTGNTFLTTNVRTKFPFLLKYSLREYQHIGLDWLVTMYDKRLNGILADEMGLGKTIMTIALLAHLACEKGIWGPHLIVVPTSVMLNWETEILKWCPAFKILTYFGSAKERKHKRQGWLKPNSFHICITTYRLVIQDSKIFKRKKWKYLILDEAHLIKNWKSQRWQTLLNYNSKRRILLTGTPLQNDLMELWSLMHFLMPHIFQSHQEFKDWFCNPISCMVDGQEKVNKEVVDRLHNVLRPFILRRLKRDVEKQLPKKLEHVIYCRLSKRQRNLYEDFIASSETQATLASANYFGMISVIMQLRKVCNHPDLFEGRPIVSSFDMAGIEIQLCSLICTVLPFGPFSGVDLQGLSFLFTQHDLFMTSWMSDIIPELVSCVNSLLYKDFDESDDMPFLCSKLEKKKRTVGNNIFEDIHKAIWEERMKEAKERAGTIAWWNSLRCQRKPMYGTNLRKLVMIKHPVFDIHEQKNNPSCYLNHSSRLADIVLSPVERLLEMLDLIESFMFAIPAARAPPPVCWSSMGKSQVFLQPAYTEKVKDVFSPLFSPIRPTIIRRQVYFPDRRLIQFDCGKLQELAVLLRRLKSEGHRALIFTQMTKMLDILEAFINLYGYTYMRLDGSTQPEERQTLMQRFNTNPKFFLFILSTRSGGVGINLVGADTVIFYDSDWNPAMDQQAQDRCHRIGQTREVHIYRLISESTIEENILKKANQKRALDDLVIQSGSYNMEFFKKLDPMELFSGHKSLNVDSLCEKSTLAVESPNSASGAVLSNADVEAAIKHAEDEADYMAFKKVQQEEAIDNQEFTEEGRLEDDDLINDDNSKADDGIIQEQSGLTTLPSILNKNNDTNLPTGFINEESAITLVDRDEDIDMLADVKQMAAAAAAAGHASSSFETHLRPIDRYAMRFLELWDPIIDKSALDFQVTVDEEEWKLDRIEKFKDDLEAEIDEDQEPLKYERWDADLATTAYRQHVEALAQRQMLEELEAEAQETSDGKKENFEVIRNKASAVRKKKSQKKSKKTKFKSLRKESLASEYETVNEGLPVDDLMHVDDDDLCPKTRCLSESPLPLLFKKKRKATTSEDESHSGQRSKRHKKFPGFSGSKLSRKHVVEIRESKSGAIDADPRPSTSKCKMGGKVSIAVTPVKRVMLVQPGRLKRRGHIWSKDCFPNPDPWSCLEDSILCAVVHEYGTNWSLVSDVLRSMSGGGFYRGRYRHPIHCCERFRELFFKYILSTADNSNNEKMMPPGYGKTLLKVTEEHVGTLLNVTSNLPDGELLVQKHFMAVLASVWRGKCRHEQHRRIKPFLNRNFSLDTWKNTNRLTRNLTPQTLRHRSNLVMAALNANQNLQELPLPSKSPEHASCKKMDICLDIPPLVFGEIFPTVVSINIEEPAPLEYKSHQQMLLSESSCKMAEKRFRIASDSYFEGESRAWAASSFSTSDIVRHQSCSKSQSSMKNKSTLDLSKSQKSKMQRTTEPDHDCAVLTNFPLSLPEPIAPIDSAELPTLSYFNYEGGSDSHYQSDTGLLYQEETALEYNPDFIAGLDNLDLFQDFIDIG